MSIAGSVLNRRLQQSFAQPLLQRRSFQQNCLTHPTRSSLQRKSLCSRYSYKFSACQAVTSLAPAQPHAQRIAFDNVHPRASTAQLDMGNTEAAPLVTTLHSSQQYQDVIEHNPGKLVVLMCKAQSCRPCKMFSRKFQRMAEQFQNVVFVDILGDETNDTRRLMMKLDVRATPTFFLYRDTRVGATLTGINENNLRNAIIDFRLPSEKDSAPLE